MAKKDTTGKRSFGFKSENLAKVKPVLESAIYAGQIIGATVTGKEDKQFIVIQRDQEWKEKMYNEKTGKMGMFVDLDTYSLTGNLRFGVVLTSKKAIQTLQQDEPKVYGAGFNQITLAFDKETYQFDTENNVAFTNWMDALGLNSDDFVENVDWEWNDDIDVPSDLAQVDDIVTKLNALAYARALFSSICLAANGIPVKVDVTKQVDARSKETINVITTRKTYAGVLPYVDGCENDLPEEN